MKKHFLSLPLSLLLIIPLYAHAESELITLASSTEESASSTEETVTNSPDLDFTLCQQQAIEARDTEISSSRSLYNTAMNNALTDRKNKEKTAIAIIDKDAKKNAIKTSADAYKNLTKKAQNDLTEARKEAWQSFEENIQKCRDNQASQVEDTTSTTLEKDFLQKTSDAPLSPMSKKEVKETPEEENSFRSMFKAFKSLFD